MGRLLLICRLAARDLKHRPGTAALLLLAMTAATTTLTLGLALHGTTSQPYATTRAATYGPDVVASVTPAGTAGNPPADLSTLSTIATEPGVTADSGPIPYADTAMTFDGRPVAVLAEGRDQQQTPIDRPKLTSGSWLRPGHIVVERAFAVALGIATGDRVELGGQSYIVSGIAVTAALPAYPHLCGFGGCAFGPGKPGNQAGLIWLTRADLQRLATKTAPLSYLLNLKLADPAQAPALAARYDNAQTSASTSWAVSWQSLSTSSAETVTHVQQVLMPASWLLGLLALASVAVLVGGRMTEQTRRVGLLKAVGSSPGLVAVVLLAEHVVVAAVAGAAGLLLGWLTAPLLTSPGAGLLGTAGAPSLTALTVLAVMATALLVAVVATMVPAIRAARTSTVAALADASRPPRRNPLLIRVSARLPIPLLLGLRLAARRPRRALLNVASITVTATGVVAALIAHTDFSRLDDGLSNPQTARLNQVLVFLAVALGILAAVNVFLLTWATAVDTRHPSALTRALGAAPQQVSSGLAVAQVLPATIGALLGIPGGIGLVEAVRSGGTVRLPSAWLFVVAAAGIVAIVAALTYIPAWFGAHRPAAAVLQSEAA